MSELIIFHAGSLSMAFRHIAQHFERQWPGVNVQMEGSGAREAARKVTDQRRPCDIIASADYRVIEDMLKPDYARFNILFAGNRLVLSFTNKSRFGDEINAENWFEILLREGVVFGHTNPELDPAGYRARLCWQLSEKYYEAPGLYQKLADKIAPTNILTDRDTIRSRMTTGEYDYFFGYESSARQNGYRFVNLPTAIDFSSRNYSKYYRQAHVQLSGKNSGTSMTVQGEPIIYGITIAEGAPNPQTATDFLEFLLEEGEQYIKKAGLISFPPEISKGDFAHLPERLRRFFQ